jgi:hypothetical protein
MENDERFYRILKEEFNLPVDTIRRIWKSQCKQANLTISAKNDKSWTFQYLGEFTPKKKKQKFLESLNKVEE